MELVFDEPGSMPARLFFIFCFAACLGGWALWKQIRGPRLRFRSLRVSGGLGLAVMVMLLLPGLNVLRPDPRLPEELAAAMEQVSVSANPYSLRASKQTGTRSGRREDLLVVETKMDVTGLPEEVFVDIEVASASLTDARGFVVTYEAPATERSWMGGIQMSRGVMEAMIRLCGRDLTVYRGEHSSSGLERDPTAWIPFENSSELNARLGEDWRLQCEVNLDCFGIRQVASVPFKNGASAIFEDGSLTVIRPPELRTVGPAFALRTRDVNRWLTRDEGRRVKADWGARERLSLPHYPPGPGRGPSSPMWGMRA